MGMRRGFPCNWWMMLYFVNSTSDIHFNPWLFFKNIIFRGLTCFSILTHDLFPSGKTSILHKQSGKSFRDFCIIQNRKLISRGNKTPVFYSENNLFRFLKCLIGYQSCKTGFFSFLRSWFPFDRQSWHLWRIYFLYRGSDLPFPF